MTDNSNSSSSAQKGQKVKTLMFQGIVGTVSLAGATAIPLLVQKALNPPTPTASPAAVQASPSPQAATLAPQVQSSSPAEESEPPGRRPKDDRHRDKPPKD